MVTLQCKGLCWLRSHDCTAGVLFPGLEKDKRGAEEETAAHLSAVHTAEGALGTGAGRGWNLHVRPHYPAGREPGRQACTAGRGRPPVAHCVSVRPRQGTRSSHSATGPVQIPPPHRPPPSKVKVCGQTESSAVSMMGNDSLKCEGATCQSCEGPEEGCAQRPADSKGKSAGPGRSLRPPVGQREVRDRLPPAFAPVEPPAAVDKTGTLGLAAHL